MESKFTKGKWEIETMGRSVTCGTAKIANCSSYNELCGGDYLPRDEEKANALLISKAPEMLELLKEHLLNIEEYFEHYIGIEPTHLGIYSETKRLIKEATEL